MTIVKGMDHHREQITAEWIDTITGEISGMWIASADRGTVREFLARFDGAGLDVALQATTGWRFLVEELQRVGADAHLAEPAETSGLKGKKQRAKTDWADARRLRELLLIGRLPESWIAPAHLLDLRARVRCRHTLVHQRTEATHLCVGKLGGLGLGLATGRYFESRGPTTHIRGRGRGRARMRARRGFVTAWVRGSHPAWRSLSDRSPASALESCACVGRIRRWFHANAQPDGDALTWVA